MDDDCRRPHKILNEISIAEEKLIPQKSKSQYEKEYENFCGWKVSNGIANGGEPAMVEKFVLAYLSEKSRCYQPASLWCAYSKLKKMIKVKEGIDLKSFVSITEFLKCISVDDEQKKSYVLQREHIQEFLLKAPDVHYLLVKVATIFGIFGACRRYELHDLCVGDVSMLGSVLLVTIRKTKNYGRRQFMIVSDDGPVDYIGLYKKYVELRPKNAKIDSLFLSYHNGKCVCQCVGKNTFGKMPSVIAQFLKLPNAEKYTGRCFRRSSATIVAESGGDTRILKQLGGWNSDKIAETYIENSVCNKNRIAMNIIAGGLVNVRSQENAVSDSDGIGENDKRTDCSSVRVTREENAVSFSGENHISDSNAQICTFTFDNINLKNSLHIQREESSDLEIDMDNTQEVEAKKYEEDIDCHNDDDALPRLSDLISTDPRYVIPNMDDSIDKDLQPPPLRPISIPTPVIPISISTPFVPMSLSSPATPNSSLPISLPIAPELTPALSEKQTKSMQQINKKHRRSKLKFRAAALLESLQHRMDSVAPEDEEHYFGQIVASTMRRFPLQQRAAIRMDILRLLYNAEFSRD